MSLPSTALSRWKQAIPLQADHDRWRAGLSPEAQKVRERSCAHCPRPKSSKSVETTADGSDCGSTVADDGVSQKLRNHARDDHCWERNEIVAVRIDHGTSCGMVCHMGRSYATGVIA